MKVNVTVTKRQVEIGSTGAFTNLFFLLNDSYIVWNDGVISSHARWRWARQARNEARIGFQTHGARSTFERAVSAAVENSECWKEIENE